MVKTIHPPHVIEYDADADTPEYDLGLVLTEPTFDADPDEFDDGIDDDDDDDDDAEFDDDDDDDALDDELEPDDLGDDA